MFLFLFFSFSLSLSTLPMTDKGPVSLVVLSHGLWGVKTHMNYIKKKLLEKYKRSIIVVIKIISSMIG